MDVGGQLRGALTASLSPWIARESGWTASFLTAASLCAVAPVAWFFVDPARRLFEAEARPASPSGATGRH